MIPQMPNHKNRENILEMLKKEEPRMIEMFKLQKQIREEVLTETQG